MEYKEFSCELQPKGVLVEVGYSRFMIGCYQQGSLQYAVSAQWCRNQGGHLPSLEQALVIAEYRGAINEALRSGGHTEIGEHLWTRRPHVVSPGSVYLVNTRTGSIDRASKEYYNAACCIIK